MRVIHVQNPGKAYSLTLGEEPIPEPGPGEILIKVASAGLNRADLLQARGLYPPPEGASEILGLEVAGRVARLGDGVKDFQLGDRVCALLTAGGYSEYALADAGCVLAVPAHIDLVAAGGLPEACFTAWTNIMDSGRLKPDETLLVHGGTSGVGSTAIQIFAARGHKVFTTAGSARKCAACIRLGAYRAINYRAEDFVAVVKAETQDKGVDVILDMVGGDYIARNIAAAALWARIVNIAFQNGAKVQVDFMPVLTKRLSLIATTLRSRTAPEKRRLRDELLSQVWPLLGHGLVPLLDRVFPLAQAQQAHEFMAESRHIGKILLSMD